MTSIVFQRFHFQVLGPEIDRGPHRGNVVRSHLLKWWWAVGAHCERHALHPADGKQRTVFDIVIKVVMGDEDRTQCRERDAGAGVLVSDAEAAIEHIGGAIAQHVAWRGT